ncbi:MAG: helix-turn-helix domain containing protein [Clostridia bacterium]|nr:helix-turn-helix domain containing protein [Clostridia bacterium]
MNTIKFRQAFIEYSLKNGVTKAAIRYKVNRQYVYRWLKRYDETLQSLADKSHKPHHRLNQHTAEELKLIADMRKRNSHAGLVVFWVKLRQRGYSRSVTGLYRVLRRQGQMAVKPPNPKYIPKPYEKMLYPGQRVQNEYFYATHKFYSFDDFEKQLKVHNYNYNKFPMRPLNWKAPADYIKAFLENGEVF